MGLETEISILRLGKIKKYKVKVKKKKFMRDFLSEPDSTEHSEKDEEINIEYN